MSPSLLAVTDGSWSWLRLARTSAEAERCRRNGDDSDYFNNGHSWFTSFQAIGPLKSDTASKGNNEKRREDYRVFFLASTSGGGRMSTGIPGVTISWRAIISWLRRRTQPWLAVVPIGSVDIDKALERIAIGGVQTIKSEDAGENLIFFSPGSGGYPQTFSGTKDCPSGGTFPDLFPDNESSGWGTQAPHLKAEAKA